MLYAITPLTDSIVQFEYLGDQYYPPLSLLNITIDLDSDYNSDPYEQYMIVNTSQTILLKEIYPFTTTEIEVISSTSNFVSYGGSTTAVTQVVSSTAQSTLSLSLVRLQMISETVQIMRFIDIHWPPSVAQMFATSNIDPSSMVINVDFITFWENQLDNQNYTVPRNFDEYEISPFLAENYDNELSNLLIWIPFVIIGSLLFNLSKKKLRNLTEDLKMPKTNSKKKFRDHFVITVHKLSRLLNQTDDSILWNLFIMFVLSIFQSGVLWALLNIRYSSALLEPSTPATNASLAISVFFLVTYLVFVLMVFKTMANNLKYILKTEEHLRPLRLRRFRILYEDCDCERSLRIFFVPISLVRSLILAATIALMADYPLPQISIFWSVNAAFILYFIFCRPLKDKWMRRITFMIEVLAFGCVTFTLIFAIIGNSVTIDPTTLDEIGFLYISFSIGSTVAGGILSLIQIIQLIRIIYRYLKELKKKRNDVHPISLFETHAKTDIISPDTISPDALQKEPFDSTSNRLKRKRKKQNVISDFDINDIEIFEDIKKLKLDFICKTSKGKQTFEAMKEWYKSTRIDVNLEDLNTREALSENKESLNPPQRINLFL